MIAQGTDEWLQQRYGNASASRIADVIAKTKSGYSASRENYLTQLVLERFGIFEESYTNDAMQHGIDVEPFARATYELRNGVMVQECGYILHPMIAHAGASPDGIAHTGVDGKTYGLIEIKSPNSKTHFEYLLGERVPPKYIPQMAWQMACTGAEWVDFISFDNRVPENLQYFQIRYARDNDYIAMLEKEVAQFLLEVNYKFELLKRKAA